MQCISSEYPRTALLHKEKQIWGIVVLIKQNASKNTSPAFLIPSDIMFGVSPLSRYSALNPSSEIKRTGGFELCRNISSVKNSQFLIEYMSMHRI